MIMHDTFIYSLWLLFDILVYLIIFCLKFIYRTTSFIYLQISSLSIYAWILNLYEFNIKAISEWSCKYFACCIICLLRTSLWYFGFWYIFSVPFEELHQPLLASQWSACRRRVRSVSYRNLHLTHKEHSSRTRQRLSYLLCAFIVQILE
jgi:hypothetical protein